MQTLWTEFESIPKTSLCPIEHFLFYHEVYVLNTVGWLYLTSHRQRVHLETAPPFTALCKGREAWFLHSPHWESNPGRCVAVHYTTTAPRQLHCIEYGNMRLSDMTDSF